MSGEHNSESVDAGAQLSPESKTVRPGAGGKFKSGGKSEGRLDDAPQAFWHDSGRLSFQPEQKHPSRVASSPGAARDPMQGVDLSSGIAPASEWLALLARAEPAELMQRHGLSAAVAGRLSAAVELGRRVARTEQSPRPDLRSAKSVFQLMRTEFVALERERFAVLLLDGKHRLQRIELVSEGTLTSSLVHPREVFCAAVREAAAAIICVHNHPSGDPEPSREDLDVTRRLIRAGRLLGIPLVDHVVVGATKYCSLRERMDFESVVAVDGQRDS